MNDDNSNCPSPKCWRQVVVWRAVHPRRAAARAIRTTSPQHLAIACIPSFHSWRDSRSLLRAGACTLDRGTDRQYPGRHSLKVYLGIPIDPMVPYCEVRCRTVKAPRKALRCKTPLTTTLSALANLASCTLQRRHEVIHGAATVAASAARL